MTYESYTSSFELPAPLQGPPQLLVVNGEEHLVLPGWRLTRRIENIDVMPDTAPPSVFEGMAIKIQVNS